MAEMPPRARPFSLNSVRLRLTRRTTVNGPVKRFSPRRGFDAIDSLPSVAQL
jgi:hypothetical protein